MTQQPSHSVSILAADPPRHSPAENVLEDRLLHKVFLFTHIPARWQRWQIAVAVLIFTFFVQLLWLPFGMMTYIAAGLYLLFTLFDWVMLEWLPKSGRSFGPIGPQLFVMTVPRLGAAGVGWLVAWLLGGAVGLTLTLVLQLFGLVVYAWGLFYEPFALGLTNRPLDFPQWPENVPPLRLLHLSDLHVERLTQRERDLLDHIAQINPDLIVITGDFLNLSYVDDPTARAEVRKILTQLSAPYGVYATLGSPPVDLRTTTPSLFDDTDIRLLRDEAAVLTFSDGRQLSLIGLDCEHDLPSDESALRSLVDLTPIDVPRILLYHSPELMPQAQTLPIDLYLCGHTHGGQIRMPLYGALLTSSVLGKQYEMGPYLEQDTLMYISRGVGLEGMSAPRMRLLCLPEIIQFTLSGKSQ